MTDFNTQLATLPNDEKLNTVSVDLTKFSEAANGLVEQAQRAEITDADTYASGGDLIKIAAVQAEKVEDQRKKLSGPFHSMWKFINTQFNTTKGEFDAVRSTMEPKMLAWKKAEDEKARKAAAEEAKRLEEEALARAALEKTEEAQDEVMESAAEASKTIVRDSGVGLTRGNYGSTTGSVKTYSTKVTDELDFLSALAAHIRAGNKRNLSISALISFKKGGMNKLAKDMRAQGVKKMPGAEFEESESLRVR